MPRISPRSFFLLVLSMGLSLGLLAGQEPSVAGAAAPVATSEVNQSPAGGTTVAAGTTITYTATVTLTVGQAGALTIQMSGDSDITDRLLACTSTSEGAADAVGSGGAPSCKWNGPVTAGTYTFTFSGKASGAIDNLLPGSVVCTDTNSSNTCTDEAAGDKVALTDTSGDTGAIAVSVAAPPTGTGQVNQVPAGGGTVAHGTVVTFTVSVNLTVAQAQALTIQLRGQAALTNRTLTCTSSTNGTADTIGSAGTPSCMWAGPVTAGTFTFTFAGTLTAALEDSVPNGDSVVCTDANTSNTCSDEAIASTVALADSDGDVGPLALIAAPVLTSEVNQSPDGGTTIANGAPVSYTVTVTLASPQDKALTIQLAGDADLTNRALTCTSSTNGTADVVGSGGAPSCMWAGPVLAGTFTFTFSGTAGGGVDDAVPAAASVACADLNSSNSCADESAFYAIALDDSDGDVGPLTFQTSFRIRIVMVAKD